MGSSWRFFLGAVSAMRTFQMQSVRCVFSLCSFGDELGYAAAVREFFSGFQWSKIPGKVGKGACLAGWLTIWLFTHFRGNGVKNAAAYFWCSVATRDCFTHTGEPGKKLQVWGLMFLMLVLLLLLLLLLLWLVGVRLPRNCPQTKPLMKMLTMVLMIARLKLQLEGDPE